jgi:hypothetical protein
MLSIGILVLDWLRTPLVSRGSRKEPLRRPSGARKMAASRSKAAPAESYVLDLLRGQPLSGGWVCRIHADDRRGVARRRDVVVAWEEAQIGFLNSQRIETDVGPG